MPANVGGGYATFTLDNRGLRTGVSDSVRMLQNLQQTTRKPLVIRTQVQFEQNVDKEEARIRSRLANIKSMGLDPQDERRAIEGLQNYISKQARRAAEERDFARALSITEAQLRTVSTASSRYQDLLIQRQRFGRALGSAGATSLRAEDKAAADAVKAFQAEDKAALQAAVANKQYAAAHDIVDRALRRTAQTQKDVDQASAIHSKLFEQEASSIERNANRIAAAATRQYKAELDAAIKRKDFGKAEDIVKDRYAASSQDATAYANAVRDVMRVKEAEAATTREATQALDADSRASLKAALAARDYGKAHQVVSDAYLRSGKTQRDYDNAMAVHMRLSRQESAEQEASGRRIEAVMAREARSKIAAAVATKQWATAEAIVKDRFMASAKSATDVADATKDLIRIREAQEASERRTATIQRRAQQTDNTQFRMDVDVLRSARQYADAIDLIRARIEMLKRTGQDFRREQILLNNTIDQANGAARRGGLAMGNLTNAVKGGLTSLAYMTTAYIGLDVVIRQFSDSVKLAMELDQQERQVQALINSVGRGSQIFQEATEFGRKYGITQKEMGEAAADAAILLQTSNSQATKVFEVLARLQARAPSKNFNDAVRSVAELQAGQLQSIEKVFNVPSRYAQQLKQQIEDGMDPIEALDRVLNQLGNTSATLDTRMEGNIANWRRFSVETSRLKATLGELFGGPLAAVAGWFARGASGVSQFINAIRNLRQATTADVLLGLRTGIQSLAHDFFSLRALMTLPFTMLTAPANIVKAFLISIGVTGLAAGKHTEEGAKKAASSYEDFATRIKEISPVLQGIANDSVQLGETDPTRKLVNGINVLVNKYQQGTITAQEMRQEFLKLQGLGFVGSKGEDKLGIVKAIERDFPTVSGQLEALQEEIALMQNDWSTAPPDMKDFYTQQIQAILNKLAELEAKSPVVVSVEVRVQQMNSITQFYDAIAGEQEKLVTDLKRIDTDYQKGLKESQNRSLQAGIEYNNSRRRMNDEYNRNVQSQNDAFGKQTGRAIQDFNQQYLQTELDYQAQRAQANTQFQKNLARSDADFAESRNRTIRDFGRSEDRAKRDFARSEERSLTEFLRGQDDKRKQSDKQQETALREHLRNLQRMQRDYDIQRNRDTEDYELERAVLLAEGRIAEAQVLASKFGVQQRRNAEDFARERSDAGDEFGNSGADRQKQLDEALQADKDAFERQRQQRLEDFELARQDAAQAHQWSLEDSDAAYAKQRARQVADFAEQQAMADAAHVESQKRAAAAFAQNLARQVADHADQMKEQERAHGEQLEELRLAHWAQEQQEAFARVEAWKQRNLDYANRNKEADTFYKDQQTKLDQALKDQQELIRRVALGMDKDLAAASIAMENATKKYEDLIKRQGAVATAGGRTTALAYAKALGDTLAEVADEAMRKGLTPYEQAIIGQSPPKKGPLRHIDIGAKNTANAWIDSLVNTLDQRQTAVMQQLTEYKVLLDSTLSVRAQTNTARYAGAVQSASADRQAQALRSRPLQLTIYQGDVVMDGQIVGRLVAPHVDAEFERDLEITSQVVESTFTPGVSQQAFRKPT